MFIIEKILYYLKDPVIRKEIWKIAHEDGMPEVDGQGTISEKRSESDLRQLEKENAVLDERVKELQAKEASLEQERSGLQKNCDKLSQEKKDLQQQCDQLKREKKDLQQQRDQLAREKEELQQQRDQLAREKEELQRKNTEQETELNRYRQDVQKWQLLYDEYCALPDSVRQSLSGIFKENGWLAFVANGAQEQNFLALWDYCRSEFNRGRLENRDVLLHLLTKLLDLMNRSQFTEPLYSFQTIEIGSSFNRDTMQKTTSSAVRGNVIHVLLPGLEKNTDDDALCRQSLVVIG